MSVFSAVPMTPLVVRADRPLLDEAQLGAVAYLDCYGGRTLESYRADLRQYFEWCVQVDVAPLAATRTHIELYRVWMEERGLAPSTVDRRLSTVCGYYRFAHIDEVGVLGDGIGNNGPGGPEMGLRGPARVRETSAQR